MELSFGIRGAGEDSEGAPGAVGSSRWGGHLDPALLGFKGKNPMSKDSLGMKNQYYSEYRVCEILSLLPLCGCVCVSVSVLVSV